MKYLPLCLIHLLIVQQLFAQYTEVFSLQYDWPSHATFCNFIDLDGDNIEDVLLTEGWIKRGGEGVEDQMYLFDTSYEIEDILVQDVDWDGDLDLLPLVHNVNFFAVMLNQQGGEFELTDYGEDPLLAIEDRDSDGDLDRLHYDQDLLYWIVNTDEENWNDTLWVNEGNSLFIFPVVFPPALHDFNQDGIMDIAVGDVVPFLQVLIGDQLALLISDGLDSYHGETIEMPEDWPQSIGLHYGDFNGDGQQDLLSIQSDNSSLFLADGSAFVEDDTWPLADVSPSDIGDLDGDLLPDIVVDGGQVFLSSLAYGAADFPSYDPELSEIRMLDYLNTGDYQLLVYDGKVAKVMLHQYSPQGELLTEMVCQSMPRPYDQVNYTDVDQDGDIDILTAFATGTELHWCENYSDGTFSQQKVLMSAIDGPRFFPDVINELDALLLFDEANNLILPEFDQQGDLVGTQILVEDACDTPLGIVYNFLGQEEQLLLCLSEDYTLSAQPIGSSSPTSYTADLSLPIEFSSEAKFLLQDHDQDGDLDIIRSVDFVLDVSGLYVFENQGNGVFAEMQALSNTDSSGKFWPTDINDDGLLDYVMLNLVGAIVLYLQSEEGSFQVSTIYQGSNDINAILSIADFDDDADIDIIYSASNGQNNLLLRNVDATATFDSEPLMPEVPGHYQFAAIDLFGNQYSELLQFSKEESLFRIYSQEQISTGNSTAQDAALHGLSLYPIPTTDVLHLETAANIEACFVYDLQGALILEKQNLNSKQLDLSALPRGSYLIKIDSESGSTTELIVLQ